MPTNQLAPKLFACSQSTVLAEKIAKEYGAELGKVKTTTFSDGEFQPAFEESVRGRRVFLIGSTFPNADNLMEMLLMCDAAKRASARHITAVMPYFGWARQDRKDQPRVAIGAKLVAKLLESAGATRIMTMDLHADQIQGFFEKPVDHLFASTIFMPYIESLKLDNLTIASPDMGGSKRAYAYSKHLHSDVVICYKQRKKANVIGHMELIGDVKGKNVIIVDFSYPRDVLIKMAEDADSIIVLDHHKTAEENLKGLDFCIFDMTRSGAVMAWEHFHGKGNTPLLFQYIQDRDLWQWKLPQSKEFSAGLQQDFF